MEAQEIFDTVARHLLTQRQRSVVINADKSEMCMYRGPNGLKCAAGVLMTDEEAAECGEKWSWHSMEGRETRNKVIKRIGYEALVRRLQDIHDNREPSEWKVSLSEAADHYELNSSVLDEF